MARLTGFTLNWRQAFADILLIVIGVSIALAADSWLSHRIEQARTNRLLDSLEHEWTVELGRLDVHIADLNRSKTAFVRIIELHDSGLENISDDELVVLSKEFAWGTFKPLSGAHSTLMADGIQNVRDPALRQAIAAWSSVMAEVGPEHATLAQLGTLTERQVSVEVARNSGELFSQEAMEADLWAYGMTTSAFYRVAIPDVEWIKYQLLVLNLVYSYEEEMVAIREVLERNLILLRKHTRN